MSQDSSVQAPPSRTRLIWSSMQQQRLRSPLPCGPDQRKHARRDLVRARIGRSPPTLRSEGVRSAFCLTLHDRLSGFGEARSAAVDMGPDLVTEVAVKHRAEPGELRADPTAGR